MATTSNRLIPILAAVGILIVGVVLYKQFTVSAPVKAGADLTAVPSPDLPRTAGADHDTPTETLRTVTTSNAELRQEVAKIIQRNNELIEENKKMRERERGGAAGASFAAAYPASAAESATPPSTLEKTIDSAAKAADAFTSGLPGLGTFPRQPATPARPHTGDGSLAALDAFDDPSSISAPGAVRYTVMAPMGYAVQTDAARGRGGVSTTRYVRTMSGQEAAFALGAANGPATHAAQAAKQSRKSEPIPYFTIPENATLAGATAMTALIGRVPIDGRVTDPMQFKAVIGRDNLAANGFELPPDVSGMIVTGIAIGDMALSCTEGKIRSATFVFNDGTIRTVSSRRRGSGSITVGGGQTSDDLGFISDSHGNPCIPGKFVTNAPAYLTDLFALGGLGVAGQAYADAQRTTYSGREGTSSQITGSTADYALGQAVAGGTNEVTRWMLQRLKNSFDAVVIPSGLKMVIHLDREIDIDKVPNARRLVHRQQSGTQLARGEHHGLE